MKFFNFAQKTKGQAIVEFAIALPILLLIVYGLIETGRLLFIFASVNNASRQAVRYGSTEGDGSTIPQYQDCAGIRAAAQRSDFLNAFEDNNITIIYDKGPSTSTNGQCTGAASSWVPTEENVSYRVTVTINANFNPIFPRILPFLTRTVANGNPITAISSRTILGEIAVQPDNEIPTFTLTHNPDPSEIGKKVTVVLTLSGSVKTPTGKVTITGEDAEVWPGSSCTNLILYQGKVSCDIKFLAAGDKAISAAYTGDADFQAITASDMHTVDKSSTTTTIAATSPDPTILNDPVNISVTVVGGVNIPTGTVEITTNDGLACTITLDAAGQGSCPTPLVFTTNGAKTITANYLGDDEHNPSVDTEKHNVIYDTDTVTIITSDAPDASQINELVTVNVSVVGTTIPTGTVTVTTNEQPSPVGSSCTFTLNASGQGSCQVKFATVGAWGINAAYTSDDLTKHTNSSDFDSHSVALPPTTTTITEDSPDPSLIGQSVKVSVTVTGGSTTPTGTVDISGAYTNCQITLDASGAGTCNVTFIGGGSKTLVAKYNGDSSHAPSDTTAPHEVTIVPPLENCNDLNIIPGFILTPGSTMTITITNKITSPLEVKDLVIQWNHDKGAHANKEIALTAASLDGTQFWQYASAGLADPPPGPYYTISPTSLFIPAATDADTPTISTFTFTMNKDYENEDNTEKVIISFKNPGCEGVSIIGN